MLTSQNFPPATPAELAAGWWTGALHPFARRSPPSLMAPWSALARRAAPHLRPEFFALELPLAPRGEPLLAAAYGGGQLAGALPLVRRGRVLEALRSDHAPAYDYVGDPEALAGVWRALSADPCWDTLVLEGIPAGSPLVTRLPTLALRDLCLSAIRQAHRSPYFALPGWEARLSSNLTRNLRRWRKRCGTMELERISRFSRADLDEGFRIEAAAWKGEAGTAIASSPELRHFYAALARLSARRGELALYFLRSGGKRIAFLFALEDERKVYALKVGYDPAFAECSPGNVLFGEVARHAEARGLLELDFLGHDLEWKRRWTDLCHDHVSLVVYRSSPRGAMAMTVRELLKPRLPSALVSAAVRVREGLSALIGLA